jgi:hypothetical protein
MIFDVTESHLGRPLLESEQIALIQAWQNRGDEGLFEVFDSLEDVGSTRGGRETPSRRSRYPPRSACCR